MLIDQDERETTDAIELENAKRELNSFNREDLSESDITRTEELRNIIISNIAKAQNLETETYKSSCYIDNETSFPIYNIPIRQIGDLFFGKFFSKVDTRFFTYIDNFIVFSSSKNAFKAIINGSVLKSFRLFIIIEFKV
jgi:hypothetical protein